MSMPARPDRVALWLDKLKPAGRLIMMLTADNCWGQILKVTRLRRGICGGVARPLRLHSLRQRSRRGERSGARGRTGGRRHGGGQVAAPRCACGRRNLLDAWRRRSACRGATWTARAAAIERGRSVSTRQLDRAAHRERASAFRDSIGPAAEAVLGPASSAPSSGGSFFATSTMTWWPSWHMSPRLCCDSSARAASSAGLVDRIGLQDVRHLLAGLAHRIAVGIEFRLVALERPAS